MAELEKVISDIEYGKDLLQNRPEQDTVDYKLYDILNDALELLKEKQPKKPIYDCPLIRCPKCKNSIDMKQKYCDECGQAIDWKDGEQDGKI